MRNEMPLRWIEQAEARQVLATALFEQAPMPSWCRMAREAAAQWLPRARSWLAPGCPTGWKLPAGQPARVRRPACRRGDDEGYSCQW